MSYELNKAQEKAVNHNSGQLLVVAGAGTGKTRVIVQRISKLLDDGLLPSSILAVTFTEKAASEMLERVLELRPDLHADLPILTFNAFGESILREFNTEIGLARNFILLGDSAQIVFLEQHLDELQLDFYAPITNPKGQLPEIAKYFSKLKQHIVTPEAYSEFVAKLPTRDKSDKLEKSKHLELSKAYANYIRLTKESNVIDYDDQIYRAIELLRLRPNIQKQLQERYKAIMIDEFQDTNPMQSELIDLLSGPNNSLMVVGDDDQSIYGFRGATLTNILEFKDRYPKSKEVTLIENYRSGQKILDAAYSLVQFNNPDRLEAKLGINKRLKAGAKGLPPEVRQYSALEYEVQSLIDDITERLARGEEPGSIAVLVRRNSTASIIGQAFHASDIDYVIVGEKYQLYKTEVVRMIVEALHAIVDTTNETSLYHTLGGGLFNIPGSSLAKLAGEARKNQINLEDYLKDQTTNTKISEALEAISKWRDQINTKTVGQLVYTILEDSGYKNKLYIEAADKPEAAQTVMQLTQFFNSLKEFESIARQPTAVQYVESFPVLEAAGESNEDNTLNISNDKITILTIHKAKGLEWDTVYIPDCSETSFPLRAQPGGIPMPTELSAVRASSADEHIAEERRLMYVAMTRAKKELIISYSRTHNHRTARKPSRFINEAFASQNLDDSDGNKSPLSLEFAAANQYVADEIQLPRTMYDGKTLKLSVSQISTYLRCPLDFYYRYVLNIPEPTSTSALYGSAIHESIESINLGLMTGAAISLEKIQSKLLSAIEAIPFESKQLGQRMKEQAKKTLQNFYDQHYKEEPIKPLEIESSFSVRLSNLDLNIRGRFDVVLPHNKGVEIRDYKTSTSVDTEDKAKRRAASSDQLTLYALVWRELHDELPKKLSLEFVDTTMVGSLAKTTKGLSTMEHKLEEMTQKITAGSFKPSSGRHDFCQHPKLD